MRLLNTRDKILTEFFEDCPEYAILSHMWGHGEVTFNDIDKPHAQTMAGYEKISKCCQQALSDGFMWVWIDTCCIDKSSSAELSEAINSMYNWYWQAEICYAYLQDVQHPINSELGPFHSDFVKSRWFRRGWTLQELLAPPSVVFFDQDWRRFGTKHDMYMIIKRASGIDERHIRHRETVYDASIGTIFSWASKRETKRPEDVAYCLLGFFRVSMPLLYGEGTRAFYRLQLELLKQTEDHTIFAWNPQEGEVYETMGILAPSPKQFQGIPNMERAPLHYGIALNHKNADTTYEMTNRGLRIALPRTEKHADGKLRILAGLTVKMSSTSVTWPKPYAVVVLEKIGPDRYRRAPGTQVRTVVSSGLSNSYTHRMYIDAESRLKDTAALHRAPCPMKITSLHCEFGSYEVHGVAIYRNGNVQPWRNGEAQLNLQELMVSDNEWASIRFSVQNTPFTITIGQHQRRAGLLVTYPTPPETTTDTKAWTKIVQKEFKIQRDRNQNTRAHETWHLDPNLIIDLRARKSRTIEDGPRWTIAIKILDEKWGVPTGDLATIQEQLRLAGV
ncbi:uncharacterized protein EKO05_0006642 [Ascochyta rabiei]|uniref:Heterokaryon incompatibility domain-containing protein n=1 Tax=Didymella rabiei TaxID=5454 RepID=A0A162W3A6_DIDRA|nr:uncharacterized protein EKO05_0006642 [Ascochyta rabiei]KZM18765.1 hypothetical protein ST47_g10000 [Ascochyta rabiei]UPX16231.1 hypothetical protein EKO05_0006642 [Ascochyta rabiei]